MGLTSVSTCPSSSSLSPRRLSWAPCTIRQSIDRHPLESCSPPKRSLCFLVQARMGCSRGQKNNPLANRPGPYTAGGQSRGSKSVAGKLQRGLPRIKNSLHTWSAHPKAQTVVKHAWSAQSPEHAGPPPEGSGLS